MGIDNNSEEEEDFRGGVPTCTTECRTLKPSTRMVFRDSPMRTSAGNQRIPAFDCVLGF